MSLSSPSSCTPGQYYSYSPNFVSGDYTNSGATITAPNISLPGGIYTSYVKRPLSFAGLQVTAVYSFTSVYNSVNIGGSVWNGGGIALGETANASSDAMVGISWVPHYLTGQWSIYNGAALLWEQTGLPHSVARTVTIYLTVSDVKISGYYTLTMRLVSPTDSIDHTEVFSTFSFTTTPTGNLFINCDTSGSTMTLSQLYITSPDSALGSACGPGGSFAISSTKIKVKPFPTYEIKPAYSFVQNSSGYWKGTDRGAAQDIYIGNFTAEATDTNFNDLQTTINSSREGITFSGFNTDLLAPNVDQSGSVVGTILDFGARKHLQFNGIGASVFDINISFRALSPSLLSTTPSLSSLRLVENWIDLHTTEIAKGQSLTQSYSYADRSSDSGRFVGYFSQTRAQTQAILAYILVTARAASFTFPTLSGVAYPFGISKGTGPFTVIIYDFKVERQNLNRWKIMIDFRESV